MIKSKQISELEQYSGSINGTEVVLTQKGSATRKLTLAALYNSASLSLSASIMSASVSTRLTSAEGSVVTLTNASASLSRYNVDSGSFNSNINSRLLTSTFTSASASLSSRVTITEAAATTSSIGRIQIATPDEVTFGTNNTKAVTPNSFNQRLGVVSCIDASRLQGAMEVVLSGAGDSGINGRYWFDTVNLGFRNDAGRSISHSNGVWFVDDLAGLWGSADLISWFPESGEPALPAPTGQKIPFPVGQLVAIADQHNRIERFLGGNAGDNANWLLMPSTPSSYTVSLGREAGPLTISGEGLGCVAVGHGATTLGNSSIAIGYQSQAGLLGSGTGVALGTGATAHQGISIGDSASSTESGISIGSGATSSGAGLAIGLNTTAGGSTIVGVQSNATTFFYDGVLFGPNSIVNDNGVGLGKNIVVPPRSILISGDYIGDITGGQLAASNIGENSICVGTGNGLGTNSTLVGNSNSFSYDTTDNVVLGSGNTGTSYNTFIGRDIASLPDLFPTQNNIAIGSTINLNDANSTIVIGNGVAGQVTENGVFIGNSNAITPDFNYQAKAPVVIGWNNAIAPYNADQGGITIGKSNTTNGQSISIGFGCQSYPDGVALGNNVNISGTAIGIGKNVAVGSSDGIGIGNGVTNINAAGSIAIGSGTSCDNLTTTGKNIAIGAGAYTYESSIAIGEATYSGFRGIAIGYNSIANSNTSGIEANSVVVGNNNSAGGRNNVVIGSYSFSYNNEGDNIVIGTNAKAPLFPTDGNFNIIIGSTAQVSVNNGSSDPTRAACRQNIAIGLGNSVKDSSGIISIGAYNDIGNSRSCTFIGNGVYSYGDVNKTIITQMDYVPSDPEVFRAYNLISATCRNGGVGHYSYDGGNVWLSCEGQNSGHPVIDTSTYPLSYVSYTGQIIADEITGEPTGLQFHVRTSSGNNYKTAILPLTLV